MVVDHPDRLHVRIDDRAADEIETLDCAPSRIRNSKCLRSS